MEIVLGMSDLDGLMVSISAKKETRGFLDGDRLSRRRALTLCRSWLHDRRVCSPGREL